MLLPHLEGRVHSTPEQQQQLEEEMPYVKQYLTQFNLSLVGVKWSVEKHPERYPLRELMYNFNNDLGWVSVEGIKKDLFKEGEYHLC